MNAAATSRRAFHLLGRKRFKRWIPLGLALGALVLVALPGESFGYRVPRAIIHVEIGGALSPLQVFDLIESVMAISDMEDRRLAWRTQRWRDRGLDEADIRARIEQFYEILHRSRERSREYWTADRNFRLKIRLVDTTVDARNITYASTPIPFVEINLYESQRNGFSEAGIFLFDQLILALSRHPIADPIIIRGAFPQDVQKARTGAAAAYGSLAAWAVVSGLVSIAIFGVIVSLLARLVVKSLLWKDFIIIPAVTVLAAPMPVPVALTFVFFLPNIFILASGDAFYFYTVRTDFVLASLGATFSICVLWRALVRWRSR